MNSNERKLKEYVKFVNSHTKEIAEFVNSQILASKDILREKYLSRIKEYFISVPLHYDWQEEEWNYWDSSGELVQNGIISLDQTISEFLENEYTGEKEATYMSGVGWNYLTYGDLLSQYTLETATDILYDSVDKYIKNTFKDITDDELAQIQCKCYDYNNIYWDSLAYNFFDYEVPVKTTDIGNIMLKDILQM